MKLHEMSDVLSAKLIDLELHAHDAGYRGNQNALKYFSLHATNNSERYSKISDLKTFDNKSELSPNSLFLLFVREDFPGHYPRFALALCQVLSFEDDMFNVFTFTPNKKYLLVDHSDLEMIFDRAATRAKRLGWSDVEYSRWEL